MAADATWYGLIPRHNHIYLSQTIYIISMRKNKAMVKLLKYLKYLYQGLRKHQKVSSTFVTKVTKLIVVFWDLFSAIKK